MLVNILNICSDDELSSDMDVTDGAPGADGEELKRREVIKNKIRAVGKMARAFSALREESEQVLELQGLAPRGPVARGALAEERAALQGLDCFQEAKGATLGCFIPLDHVLSGLDKINERMPPRKDSGSEDLNKNK